MKRRKWPTVPEILAQADSVTFRHDGKGWHSSASYEIGTSFFHVHQATVPNLLKTLQGSNWIRQEYIGATEYTPPAQTGASDAPSV
jgi:hypothetical protein